MTFACRRFAGKNNKFEKRIREIAEPKGFAYEATSITYTVQRKYIPDFVRSNIVVEAKGMWPAEDRTKLLAVRKQNPQWKIILVFQKPYNKLNKTSKTTYAQWCIKNKFVWFDEQQFSFWFGSN